MFPLSSGKPARQVFAEDDRKTVQWLRNEHHARPLSAEEGEQMLVRANARASPPALLSDDDAELMLVRADVQAWEHDLFVYRREGMELADYPLRIAATARYLWRERGILSIPISLLPDLAGEDKESRHFYYRPVSTSTVPPAYVMRRLGLPWCTPLQARWEHVRRMSAAVWGLADMPRAKNRPAPGPVDPSVQLASRKARDARLEQQKRHGYAWPEGEDNPPLQLASRRARMSKELERRLAQQERAGYKWPALKEALRQEEGQSKQPLTFYVNEFLFTVNANPTRAQRDVWNLLQERHGISERTLLRRLAEGERAFAAVAVPGETWHWEGASDPALCQRCRKGLPKGKRLWCPECEQAILAEQMQEIGRAQCSDVDS